MAKKGSTPKPPDPAKTAEAQTGTNIATAIAQGLVNQTNQVTPDGTLSYAQTGSTEWKDPVTGKVFLIPQTTATQTLSPQQQAIKTQTDAAQLGLGTIANQLTSDPNLAKSFDGSNEATEARLMELGRKRLDPMWSDREADFRTELTNKGLMPGTEAFDREYRNFAQGRNDSYNSLMLQGRGQAFNEALTENNQPLNKITALLSGSQVSHPNYVNTPQSNVATTDYAGLVNQNYQAKLAAQQAKAAGFQSILGGLFGMGGQLGSAAIMASDERLKEEVEKVGEIKGHNIYEYNYKGRPKGERHIGMMAQEVERSNPGAVIKTRGGMRLLDYGKALMEAA